MKSSRISNLPLNRKISRNGRDSTRALAAQIAKVASAASIAVTRAKSVAEYRCQLTMSAGE